MTESQVYLKVQFLPAEVRLFSKTLGHSIFGY